MEIRKSARVALSRSNFLVRPATGGEPDDLYREPCDRSVLLVEDDDGIRDMLVAFFGLDGAHAMVGVGNGREALDHLRSHVLLPGVIITDLTMPIMSGWELLQALRADPVLASTPVIVISAALAREKVTHADRFIPKPIEPEHLSEVVIGLCEACAWRAVRGSRA